MLQPDMLDPGIISLKLVTHASPDVRIAALGLAVHSVSSIEPLSANLLRCLRQIVPYYHAEVNAKARNEFLSLMKKLCLRLRGSISSLTKASYSSSRKPDNEQHTILPGGSTKSSQALVDDKPSPLAQQIAFRDWYMVFLTNELRPTASYQRHISALKMLFFMFQLRLDSASAISPAECIDAENLRSSQRIAFDAQLLRSLMDLTVNPFNDVRWAAASALKMVAPMLLACSVDAYPGDQSLSAYNTELLRTLHRAEATMHDTGRADHADGLGRLYELHYESCGTLTGPISCDENQPSLGDKNRMSILASLWHRLDGDIAIARENLRVAVSTSPLHGYLIALRYNLPYHQC